MTVNLTRYAMWFAGVSLAVLTVVILLRLVFGVALGTAVVPILPAMAAALVEGAQWAKTSRAPIPRPWRAAAAMTGVALGLTLLAVIGTVASALGTVSPPAILVLLVVYCAFWLVTNRIFLTMGARNAWALQDRQRDDG